MSRLLLACFLSMLTGCATTQQSRDHYRVASTPIAPVSAVVFVANGAGDSRSASQNLSKVVAETSAPLQIETFVWSRGCKRIVADQVDHDNHLAQGRRLAGEVTAYRQAYPNRRICLLGQSAGGAVVLSAAELLPPNSISRIILLSPSVCTGYDLRSALQACHEGIDLFCSQTDRWVLGLAMRVVGTTEGDCRRAAGRLGFETIVNTPTDAALYARLRQHSWDPSVKWTGHNGGHFGNLEPKFLCAYVLPLLAGGCP
jgi:pimeloyl-ACP methyl ester carboxylesterase